MCFTRVLPRSVRCYCVAMESKVNTVLSQELPQQPERNIESWILLEGLNHSGIETSMSFANLLLVDGLDLASK